MSNMKAKMVRVQKRLKDAWRTLLRRLREYTHQQTDRAEAERLRRLHRQHCRR